MRRGAAAFNGLLGGARYNGLNRMGLAPSFGPPQGVSWAALAAGRPNPAMRDWVVAIGLKR